MQQTQLIQVQQSSRMKVRVQMVTRQMEKNRMDGDEGKIRQMTGIFLENALKYTKECGKIEIHLEKKGKWTYLRVINDTEPMEPGKKEELFERFYRTEQSRNSRTGGSGIGLSIAKAIVSVHKGKITAESPDGQSLKIEVKLPTC